MAATVRKNRNKYISCGDNEFKGTKNTNERFLQINSFEKLRHDVLNLPYSEAWPMKRIIRIWGRKKEM